MEQELDISDITAKLESTVQMVWPTFCNEELNAIGEVCSSGYAKTPVKAACTHILGGFAGSVSVEIETELLRDVAKYMMRLQDTCDDDLNSVIKELTNVISGNMKVHLSPEHSILSTPKSFDRTGFSFDVPDSKTITTIAFKAEGRLVIVKLHRADWIDIPIQPETVN